MKITKKIQMVALFQLQSFDDEIHQNYQLLVYFCFLIIVVEIFKLISCFM